MPCGQHGYCDGCFCTVIKRAIVHEANYSVPCGSTKCPHPSFQTAEATQRNDVLGRYASRIPEYNTRKLERAHCSNRASLVRRRTILSGGSCRTTHLLQLSDHGQPVRSERGRDLAYRLSSEPCSDRTSSGVQIGGFSFFCPYSVPAF
jgi:hypothetical protein